MPAVNAVLKLPCLSNFVCMSCVSEACWDLGGIRYRNVDEHITMLLSSATPMAPRSNTHEDVWVLGACLPKAQ